MLEESFPDKTSEFAAEGTTAHELADLDLQLAFGLISPKQHKARRAKQQQSQYYSSAMDAYVQSYVDYVLEQYKEGDIAEVEQRLDFSHVVPHGFGTGDMLIVSEPLVRVIDLKYGKGVRVDAEKNSQLMLYGLGALNEYGLAYDITEVELTVVQPRLEHISSWRISARALEQWAEEHVRPKAEMAIKGKGELKAGSWCRFCKAKATCKALHAQALQAARWEFETPKTLSLDQLVQAHAEGQQLSTWLSAVDSHLMSLAMSGVKIPGMKLVLSSGRRAWADTDAAQVKLAEMGFEEKDYLKAPKLKGIGDIADLMPQDDFEEHLAPFIQKKPGSPSLVSEDDPRPEYNSAQQDFS